MSAQLAKAHRGLPKVAKGMVKDLRITRRSIKLSNWPFLAPE